MYFAYTVYAITVDEKRGCTFEREQGEAYEGVSREAKEERNVVIML